MLKKLFRPFGQIFKYIFVVIPRTVKQSSYYPEKKRKCKLHRYWDMYMWFFKYLDVNEYYNLFGLDVKGEKIFKHNLLSNRKFRRTRDKYNLKRGLYNYAVLLRDKFVFSKYLGSLGLPVVDNIAVSINGEIRDDSRVITYDELLSSLEGKSIFIKVVNGECGIGVYHLFVKNNKFIDEQGKEFDLVNQDIFKKNVLVYQEALIQDKEVDRLNSSCINTIRLITCNTKEGIKILGGIFRLGAGDKSCDNLNAGGIGVPINPDGTLYKYGYYRPKRDNKKITEHPVSHVKLEGFKLPYFEESIELIKKAHTCIFNTFAIGWDIAITDKGPVLIEGNDNFEEGFSQIIKGFRKEWLEYISKRL